MGDYHTRIELNRAMGKGVVLTLDLSFKGDVSELFPAPILTFDRTFELGGYHAFETLEHIAVIDRANTGDTIGFFLKLYPFTDNLCYIQEFSMNALQRLAYDFMNEQGSCTVEDFQKAGDCSKATAHRILQDMVSHGYAEFISYKNKHLYALSAKGETRREKMRPINPDERPAFIVGTESEE